MIKIQCLVKKKMFSQDWLNLSLVLFLVYIGQYISVNSAHKLVLIASALWDYKIYERKFGFQGMRLETLCHFRRQA